MELTDPTTRVEETREPFVMRKPSTIRAWDEFNFGTLKRMDRGLLKRALKRSFDSDIRPEEDALENLSFDKPESVEMLTKCLSSTIQYNVNCCLLQTQREWLGSKRKILRHVPKPGIGMRLGQPTQFSESWIPGGWHKAHCAGCLPVLDSENDGQVRLPKNILPGHIRMRSSTNFDLLDDATKYHSKLDYDKLGPSETPNVSNGHFYAQEYILLTIAIERIYSHLCHAKCRYGYIITETQLCVVRIRPSSKRDQTDLMEAMTDDGLLEFKNISYGGSDSSKLNVSTALWWLHLLAAADHKLDWDYEPLKRMTFRNGRVKLKRKFRAPSEEYEASPPPYIPKMEFLSGMHDSAYMPRRQQSRPFPPLGWQGRIRSAFRWRPNIGRSQGDRRRQSDQSPRPTRNNP